VTTTTDAAEEAVTSSPWPFRIGLALGVPLLLIGIRGVLVNERDTRPAELARWILGSALLHDAVLVPVVAVIAWALRRLLPGWSWPAVRWGLFATAVLVAVSRPFVARYGWTPANRTALDRPYGRGVAVAVAVIWVAAGTWLLVDGLVRRRGWSGNHERSAPPQP
jgi:hypothetical protein